MKKEDNKESTGAWDKILNGKKTLSNKEAKGLEKISKELRSEKGWRVNISP